VSDPAARGSRGEAARAAVALALAGAFLAWAIGSTPEAMRDVAVALPRYAAGLALAALAAGAACALAWRAGRVPLAARAGWALAPAYLAALKAAGFAAAPWVALALVAAAALRAPSRAAPSLPWLHAMGSMAGVHLALTATRYAEGAAALPGVLAGLRALLP
jgi:hypothetical protein